MKGSWILRDLRLPGGGLGCRLGSPKRLRGQVGKSTKKACPQASKDSSLKEVGPKDHTI